VIALCTVENTWKPIDQKTLIRMRDGIEPATPVAAIPMPAMAKPHRGDPRLGECDQGAGQQGGQQAGDLPERLDEPQLLRTGPQNLANEVLEDAVVHGEPETEQERGGDEEPPIPRQLPFLGWGRRRERHLGHGWRLYHPEGLQGRRAEEASSVWPPRNLAPSSASRAETTRSLARQLSASRGCAKRGGVLPPVQRRFDEAC
jgi:hypothetical protein